jgi:hypothetical protein
MVEIETRAHILSCNEAGPVDVLHKSIDLLDQWLKDSGTEVNLRKFLIRYAHGRGGRTMQEIVEEATKICVDRV